MTMPSLNGRAHDVVVGDAALPDRPRRRRFTADYKLTVLAEYDRLTGDGDKGALLRREGLYSSHIVEWRRAREAGLLQRTGAAATTVQRRSSADSNAALAKANRRADRLEAELAKTRMALEIMGKAHALLDLLAESADTDPKPKQ